MTLYCVKYDIFFSGYIRFQDGRVPLKKISFISRIYSVVSLIIIIISNILFYYQACVVMLVEGSKQEEGGHDRLELGKRHFISWKYFLGKDEDAF